VAGANLVVIADDDSDIRVLVERRLARRGWEVVAAADGTEALELVRARRPAAAVLDSTMPGMSGEEVVAAMRADPGTRAIPAILLSAAEGAAEPADVRLMKPFDIETLDAALHRLVDARGSAPGD
jgi:CheY-like chemotaxis protein